MLCYVMLYYVILCYVMWNLFTVGSLQFFNEANQNHVWFLNIT